MIAFVVYGQPRGKGSYQVRATKDGHGRAHPTRRDANWQTLVAMAAQEHAPAEGLLEGPVSVALRVYLAKPASAPKRRPTWPVTRGALDADKACRAVLDALTGVVWTDDSAVVELHAFKAWASDGRPRIEVEVDRPADYVQWAAGLGVAQPRELPGLLKGVVADGR